MLNTSVLVRILFRLLVRPCLHFLLMHLSILHWVYSSVKGVCYRYTDGGLGRRVIAPGRELGEVVGAFKSLDHGCDWIGYANHKNDGHPVVTGTGLSSCHPNIFVVRTSMSQTTRIEVLF